MANAILGDRTPSLGDLISALHPGDACPWCESRLQGVSALKQVGEGLASWAGKIGARDSPESALRCPECGSEICPADDVTHIHGRRTLGAAA